VEQPTSVDLVDGSASVDFGARPLEGRSDRSFSIRNTGTATLTGLGIGLTGSNATDFTVVANPTAPLGPGGSTEFTVRFSPASAGARTAALHIFSNDSDESPFDITLRGTGVTPIQAAQQAYLKASNTGGGNGLFTVGDTFGFSVAVSGNTAVVGAPREASNTTGVNGNQNDESARFSGAAYVFVRNGTNWSQQAYLKASNTGAGDSFGQGVAISGDTLVVGAPSEDSSATGVNGNQNDNTATDSGAAYVFVRSGTIWTQQAYLKASNTDMNNGFGMAVAVSGDTVVVGSPGEDNSAANSGAAYVFVRNGTNWSQQGYLKASNTDSGDAFGWSIATSGDSVVVGAISEDSSATGLNGDQSDNSAPNSGAAYVFVRSGTTWTQQAYLKASNTGIDDSFGESVSMSGDTLAIAASGEDSSATGVNGNQSDNSAPNSGAAYVFVRSEMTWTQQAYLKASNTGRRTTEFDFDDRFGRSVSVSGDTVVVGARGEDGSSTGVNGDEDSNGAVDSGAAYVFVRNGSAWSQQAYLKASNTGGGVFSGDFLAEGDAFGWTVAVSGDTVLVGAIYEDSRATGVNGVGNDPDIIYDSGAAYVFSRLGPVMAPRLNIQHTAGNVRVSWLLQADDFVLDCATNLNAPNTVWDQVPLPYDTNATHISITVTSPVGNKFYRLRKP
jgi:hypothetical protein